MKYLVALVFQCKLMIEKIMFKILIKFKIFIKYNRKK